MMTSFRSIGFVLALLFLLSGCATPANRIKENQELFDSFPVATQARIRGGQIDLGFTEEMTRIALGDPQRKLIRRTPDGTSTIWLYIDTIQRYERQHADINGMTIYGSGVSGSIGGSAWFNVLQEREYTRLRAEFQNGQVVAIEEAVKEQSKP